MKKSNQSGFAVVEALLVVVILAMVAGTGYFVWHAKQNTDDSLNNAASSQQGIVKVSKVTDFASCKAASGSKILETYPEQCVTKAGKTYTQGQQFLEIKEAGIKLTLSQSIEDAYYSYSPNTSGSGFTGVRLSVRSLDAYSGCQAGNGGIAAIGTFKEGEVDPTVGDFAKAYPGAPKVNDKFYFISADQYDCTLGKNSELHNTARHAFVDAYTTIQPL